MGTLKSAHNWSGRIVGGTILGEPAIQPDGSFVWDGAVANGVVDDAGNVVTETLGEIVAPELAPEVPPVTSAEKEAGVERYAFEVIEGKNELVAFDKADVVLDLEKIEIQYETVEVDIIEIKATDKAATEVVAEEVIK